MKALIAILVIAGAAGALALAASRLETRAGYGRYYGLARLTGGPLDIGPTRFETLTRRATRNDALVCPPGLCVRADADASATVYDVSPAELLTRLRRVALAEPRTHELACNPDCDHSLRFVQYSRLFRFPDTVDVAAFRAGEGKSTLAIYSRSLVGRGDLGVNAARVKRWLTKLDSQKG
jgi:uncharacterized protein (DUF1499 family)